MHDQQTIVIKKAVKQIAAKFPKLGLRIKLLDDQTTRWRVRRPPPKTRVQSTLGTFVAESDKSWNPLMFNNHE